VVDLGESVVSATVCKSEIRYAKLTHCTGPINTTILKKRGPKKNRQSRRPADRVVGILLAPGTLLADRPPCLRGEMGRTRGRVWDVVRVRAVQRLTARCVGCGTPVQFVQHVSGAVILDAAGREHGGRDCELAGGGMEP
jgi:hypothetical protein